MALYSTTLIVGSIWLALGIATYYALPAQQGSVADRDDRDPAADAGRNGAGRVRGVSWSRSRRRTYSERAIATALKLASHKKGDVRVIVTLDVPQHLDIEAPLPEAEATAQAIIEAARQWAGRRQRIKGEIAKVRAGEAGHRIVREAIELRADAIVMPMPHHRPAGKLLSRTLETVLGKRPCRVIIDSDAGAPVQRATARLPRLRFGSPLQAALIARDGASTPGRTRARGCSPIGSGVRHDRAAPRRPAPVRDRLQHGRLVDLLRARRRRGVRARAHAGRVPGRRPAVRDHDADVLRGHDRASRARRLGGHGALRVQRALELHRGLGDPARLPDPDRDQPRSRSATTWRRSGRSSASRASTSRSPCSCWRASRGTTTGAPPRGGGAAPFSRSSTWS